jgi:thiamine kinase-like enzyme
MARLDPVALAAALPCWGRRVSPVPLAGGLTNDNFVVEDGGRRYVVRVGGDIPAHNIVRTSEAAASRAAHAAGVSPRVHYADSAALVIDFVDGRTLTPEDVRAPENRARLVDLIKRAHREIPKHFRGPAPLFWVFQVVRHYDRVLREFRSPHVSMLSALAPMAERLEQAVGPIDIVFGHNDMLAANLLDDGQRLWLVDWEYAGFNAFRLGRSRLEQRSVPRGRRTHDGALFRAPDRPWPAPAHDGDDGRVAPAGNALEHGLRRDERDRLRLPRLYVRESAAFQRRLCGL